MKVANASGTPSTAWRARPARRSAAPATPRSPSPTPPVWSPAPRCCSPTAHRATPRRWPLRWGSRSTPCSRDHASAGGARRGHRAGARRPRPRLTWASARPPGSCCRRSSTPSSPTRGGPVCSPTSTAPSRRSSTTPPPPRRSRGGRRPRGPGRAGSPWWRSLRPARRLPPAPLRRRAGRAVGPLRPRDRGRRRAPDHPEAGTGARRSTTSWPRPAGAAPRAWTSSTRACRSRCTTAAPRGRRRRGGVGRGPGRPVGPGAAPGRMSVELHPPVGIDKGTVVTGWPRGSAPWASSATTWATSRPSTRSTGCGPTGLHVAKVAVRPDELAPELAAAADVVVDGPPRRCPRCRPSAPASPG